MAFAVGMDVMGKLSGASIGMYTHINARISDIFISLTLLFALA